ncbi:hypothetical protein ACQP0C_31430 [Nocardia sp. CA-129566]|uniref:hypothetical protein n=1 Tax=Nocardia sp. CA-129566 TaxID=3239976 RepID=UPI003D9593D6
MASFATGRSTVVVVVVVVETDSVAVTTVDVVEEAPADGPSTHGAAEVVALGGGVVGHADALVSHG